MSWPRSEGNRDRIRMGAPLEGEVDDAPDHFIVAETGGASGASESPGAFRQITVGVDVDDERRPVGRETDVEAAVVAQLHRGETGARHGADARLDLCG